ncbi:MAG: sulfotransferase [Pirellulales bacterium]|nr:sulfotransferase [Pirellulales bacterium]
MFHFVSGLPRSGTTLLMNLLGQNPAHHVGPTSGLIHLMRAVKDRWPECQEFQAQGLEVARSMVLGAMRGLFTGFYEEPLTQGKIVFDKSRGWVHYVELVESILGRPIRVITMIRDIRAIAGSWEKIYRRRGIEFKMPDEDASTAMDTVEGRTQRILAPDQVTGRSVARVRDALLRCPDRLVIVPYDQLTAEPSATMAAIHDALDLPPFDYNPDHVEQITHEDDNYLGADLHSIRSKIAPQPPEPWRGVLPDPVAEAIAREYEDLNRLAAGPVVVGRKNP